MSNPDQTRTLGVGVIGAGWLGDVHARAWARLRHHYPELGVLARFAAVADSVESAGRAAQRGHGFATVYADWRDLVADPDVEVVSVTAPNALHRDIGVAVAQAGKHLWIEKPVGLGAADAVAVDQAVTAAGVRATVGFNYRNFPAFARLREVVSSGEIGRPTHARVQMLTDYAAHPLGLLTWRYSLADGGHGVLGDLGSHAVDLARSTVGDIARVVARTATFLAQRPLPDPGRATYGHGLGASDAPTGAVENEDYLLALAETATGVLLTIECSRVAVGEQNNYAVAVHGTRGRVSWDFRAPGELQLAAGDDYADQPTQRVFVGPGDGDHVRFQPGSAIPLSYDDSKVIELARFVSSILGGDVTGAQPADAVASAQVLDAILRSAASAAWVEVAPSGAQGVGPTAL